MELPPPMSKIFTIFSEYVKIAEFLNIHILNIQKLYYKEKYSVGVNFTMTNKCSRYCVSDFILGTNTTKKIQDVCIFKNFFCQFDVHCVMLSFTLHS